MSKILKEQIEAETYINNEFDYLKTKKIALTLKNAIKIEAMLKIDSNYRDSADINNVPNDKFIYYLKGNLNNTPDSNIKEYGSSTYWISRFVKLLNNEEIEEGYDIDLILKGVICSIDKENSTHLSSRKNIKGLTDKELYESKGRQRVFKRLKDKFFKDSFNKKEKLQGYDNFKKYINNPTDNNYEIINIIAKPDLKYKAENFHFSFATKFCRYVCIGLNTKRNSSGEIININEKADNYYVYDGIIWDNLKYYIQGVNINEFENKILNNKLFYEETNDKNGNINCGIHYKYYFNLLEKINKNAGQNISRNAFDHIIWYFNK